MMEKPPRCELNVLPSVQYLPRNRAVRRGNVHSADRAGRTEWNQPAAQGCEPVTRGFNQTEMQPDLVFVRTKRRLQRRHAPPFHPPLDVAVQSVYFRSSRPGDMAAEPALGD